MENERDRRKDWESGEVRWAKGVTLSLWLRADVRGWGVDGFCFRDLLREEEWNDSVYGG